MSKLLLALKRAQLIVVVGVAALLLCPAISSAQGFKVVVNSAVADASVSKSSLSKMFLKQQKVWSDGAAVVPVDLPAGSDVRAQFSKAVHGRATRAIMSFWNRIIFSGRGTPPVVQPTDAEVMAFVRVHAGAVGYVSAEAKLGDGIKILAVSDL